MPNSTDILIIGGGVIGLSCAWQLAQRGREVVLLERRNCGGASAASLGALWPASPLRNNPIQRIQRESLWRYAEFAKQLEEVTGIPVRYRRCQRLELLRDEAQRSQALLEAEAARTQWPSWEDAPAMEVISSEEVAELEPNVAPHPFGALLCRATAQVDPLQLIESLKAACHLSGVEIRVDSPVHNATIMDGLVQSVQTHSEVWRPRAVLVAAGAWTSQLDKALADLAPIRPVKGQALKARLANSPSSRIIKSGTIYIVPSEENECLIGATTEPQAGFDENANLAGITQIITGATMIMPALNYAAFVSAWAGLRPQGMDRRPFIGRAPHVMNLYFATGHYKIGIGLAPLTAEIITELITEGSTVWDISHFRPGRM